MGVRVSGLVNMGRCWEVVMSEEGMEALHPFPHTLYLIHLAAHLYPL